MYQIVVVALFNCYFLIVIIITILCICDCSSQIYLASTNYKGKPTSCSTHKFTNTLIMKSPL